MPEPSTVNLKAIAFPSEHGGWGLLAEPLLLGLLVAPSPAGAAVAAAMTAGYLCRHPARLAAADWLAGTRHARTRPACLLAAAYGGTAVAAGLCAFFLAGGALWLVAALAAPAAAFYLARDVRRRSRDLAAELAGALALTAGAPAVAVAAGWRAAPAFGLWLLMASRGVGAVLEVRCRLRRQRGLPAPAAPVFATYGAFTAAAVAAAGFGAIPAVAALVPAVLLARAAWNLQGRPRAVRPQDVGWSEVRVGAAAVGVWAVAYGVIA